MTESHQAGTAPVMVRRSRLAMSLWLYLLLALVYVGYRGVQDLATIWPNPATDFRTFYQSGGLVVSGYRSLIYGGPGVKEVPQRFANSPGNFFNPPLFALAYTPLTIFDLQTAKAVHLAIMIVAAAGFIWHCRRWSRDGLDLALFAVALASFWPLYISFQVGQPTVLFMLLASLAFAALEAGNNGWAGALLSILVLKPSIAIAHAGLGLFMGDRRTFVALAGGTIILGLVPFAITGLSSIDNFRALLSAAREDSFTLWGGITAGAAYMFNWNGFIARLTLANPRPLTVLPLYLATAFLTVKVWARMSLLESWLAAALFTNLAMPHMLYYDCLLLLPPSFALAARRRQPALLVLMAMAHLAINVSMWEILRVGFEIGHKQGYALIVATPAMFLLLAYLALEPEMERWRHPTRILRREAVSSA